MYPDQLPENVQAVVFDFDGTLADSYAAIAASVNHVRAHHGLAPLAVAEVKRHVGRGTPHLLEQTIGSGDVEGDLARYRKHHPSVMAPLTHLLPGAMETLAAVKRTNRKSGICSNKPREFTEQLLEAFDIAKLVDVVVGPEDVARPKPAPDMLTLAVNRLRSVPSRVLYIGDMVVDIQTARAAGVPVWVVPTGSDTVESLQQANPDRLLRDLDELKSTL